jgi:hypothetical protein
LICQPRQKAGRETGLFGGLDFRDYDGTAGGEGLARDQSPMMSDPV